MIAGAARVRHAPPRSDCSRASLSSATDAARVRHALAPRGGWCVGSAAWPAAAARLRPVPVGQDFSGAALVTAGVTAQDSGETGARQGEAAGKVHGRS